jgi:hypothetical protein
MIDQAIVSPRQRPATARLALAFRAIRKRITIALIACKWATKVIGS